MTDAELPMERISFSHNAFPVVCFTSKVNVYAWFWMWFKFKLSCKNIETISYNIDKVQDLVVSLITENQGEIYGKMWQVFSSQRTG